MVNLPIITSYSKPISSVKDHVFKLTRVISNIDVKQQTNLFQVLNRLRKHAEKQEEINRALEQKLMEERDRRKRLERKMEEIVEGSTGRIFSFMVSYRKRSFEIASRHLHSACINSS